MKRISLLSATLLMSVMMSAQTMYVNMGDVSYAIEASQAGDMLFNDGTSLTIGQKTYPLSKVTSIQVAEGSVADNTVAVAYDGGKAKVVIAGNLAPYVSATVNGGHVAVIASESLQQEVTYSLSGQSADGSFYMDGDYAIQLVLNGLTLTNPDSAAVNIQDGKLITIVLADGTANTLTDGLTHVSDDGSDGHNAAFYVDGHTSWTGTGSLTITGNVKHGFSSDEYTLFGDGLGNVTIANAVGDGLHINQYFKMLGGTLNINAAGDGVDVGKKKTDKTDNGFLTISGGTLNVTTTGNATKALKCDSCMIVTGGNITATTTGSAIYDSSEADISSNAAAKCDATFTMTGGTMYLTSTGDGGKGINATGDITISGGTLTVVTIGDVFTYEQEDTKPQAIKSDGNITLSGGTILSCASANDGTAFKTDLMLYTNGATLMGIGGKACTRASSSTHNAPKYKDVKVSGGSTLSYDGVSFTIPAIYNNSSAKVIVSSPAL